MKGRKTWFLCALALVLLLTACPGPESTVPKGKVTISLSDEAMKYFSDTDSVSVELRNTENGNNQSEGIFTLAKSKPYATYTVVPGRYVILLTNSNNLPVNLSENSVEVKADSDLKVVVNLSENGTVSILADTELMDDSDKLILSFSGTSGLSYTIAKSEIDQALTLPVGTYSVTLNTNSPWVEATSSLGEVTVEQGKATQLPVSFTAYGELAVTCAVKPAMPLSLKVSKGDEQYKSFTVDSESLYERLPVGDYSLELSTDDKNVDILLSKNTVSITKGDYSNVTVSYEEKGYVQFDLSNELQTLLSESEESFTVKITAGSTEIESKVFSKDTLNERTIVLPVGSYMITLEGSLENNKITSLTNEFNVTKGSTETIKLDIEEIGHVALKFNEVLKEFNEDEYLTVSFSKGIDTVREIKITKNFDFSEAIEIPTGNYTISVYASDSSKYIVTTDSTSILVQDETVNVIIEIAKAGVCEIKIENASGIKNSSPITVNFFDGEELKGFETITGSNDTESIILPEGSYTVKLTFNSDYYNATVNNESVFIKQGEKASLNMKVETDGYIDISIDVGFEPSFKFKVIKYTKYVESEKKNITYLEIVNINNSNLDEKAYTVVWYDPDPYNPLPQNVGAKKEFDIIQDRLNRIEVRIIYDGEVIAARKIDPNKIEEV